ncbi:MAG: hypothetical protein GKR94_30845 [Gammaproteobacteria bacterium]|nr:hypothetical protein [Gammaproteobacteria bacterium]
MTIGRSSRWLSNLKDIDNELISCVTRVWPTVIARLTIDAKEDKITERLVDLLRKDGGIVKLGFLCLQFKLREEDRLGDFTTKGILDMALFLDQDHERYIAYECKRLNVIDATGKRIRSLADAYAKEGIMRYVTAKYAERLPYGCMIGYVMDGDSAFAFQQLKTAIVKRKDLHLASQAIDSSTSPSYTSFETTHKRQSNQSIITVRHRLLSMRPNSYNNRDTFKRHR